jgi:glycosyltransferase involved in cell wall biosynthesis
VAVPRVLLVHGETLFCAGAQRMLGYFLEGAEEAKAELVLAHAPAEALTRLLPEGTRTFSLPINQRFTPIGLLRQVSAIQRIRRIFPFDLLHGWTARDWELTSAASWRCRKPAAGLLHDHPLAPHISPARRRLMLLSARWQLSRVLCVSGAVRQACAEAGYPKHRLCTIANGIPLGPAPAPPSPGESIRLGFLGVFSERKGMRTLFELLDHLAREDAPEWEMVLGGGAQDPESEKLVEELRCRYQAQPWWRRVVWEGWVRRPAEFLKSIDLLLLTSSEFDPFPTVLLEAGAASRPSFASDLGGVPEIIQSGVTGWLFEPTAISNAATTLAMVLRDRTGLIRAGKAAARRVRENFSVQRMARDYGALYREMISACG